MPSSMPSAALLWIALYPDEIARFVERIFAFRAHKIDEWFGA